MLALVTHSSSAVITSRRIVILQHKVLEGIIRRAGRRAQGGVNEVARLSAH